ncbi:hypothetical protein SRDD_44660 [Serratia sp. DD3]|nr:hypothetical protein SRDD_44660 [Serratia sp. DD3]
MRYLKCLPYDIKMLLIMMFMLDVIKHINVSL